MMMEDREIDEFARAYNAKVSAMIARDLEACAKDAVAYEKERAKERARIRAEMEGEDLEYYWQKF